MGSTPSTGPSSQSPSTAPSLSSSSIPSEITQTAIQSTTVTVSSVSTTPSTATETTTNPSTKTTMGSTGKGSTTETRTGSSGHTSTLTSKDSTTTLKSSSAATSSVSPITESSYKTTKGSSSSSTTTPSKTSSSSSSIDPSSTRTETTPSKGTANVSTASSSTLTIPTTTTSLLSTSTNQETEVIFCDTDSESPVTPSLSTTTSSASTATKSCLPSMFNLNISSNENLPTPAGEEKAVVGTNLPTDCISSAFEWKVEGETVSADSPFFLSLTLASGQVTRVCLYIDDKHACGFIQYSPLTSPSPFPSSSSSSTSTSSPSTTTKMESEKPVDPDIEKIKEELLELIDGRYNNATNGSNLIEDIAKIKDPAGFLDTLTKVLQGQVDLSKGALTTDQVLSLMKKYIDDENDDAAKAMAVLIGKLSNVSITDTATLNSILSTLDAALKGSLAYSLIGDGKTLANVYGVIFGTIKGPQVNMMSAKCSAQVQGNVIYLRGDIRSAKFQNVKQPITMSNNVRQVSSSVQAIGFSANFGMSPFENYTISQKRQLFKIIGDTQMVIGSGNEEPVKGLCLWNCTLDPLGDKEQTMTNMTFTSWVTVSSGTLTINQNSSTLNSLRLGQLIPSVSLKITARFGDTDYILTYLGGNLQLMEMNANFLSFSVTGGAYDPSPDVLINKNIVDPMRIEGVSTDLLRLMDAQSTQPQLAIPLTAAKGYTMMMITGFQDVPPLSISATASEPLQKAWFRPLNSSLTRVNLENYFVSGSIIPVMGEIVMADNKSTAYQNVSLVYDGTRILVDTVDKQMIIEDAQWKATVISNSPQISITGGYFAGTGLEHTQTILEMSETSRVIIDRGTIIRNASDGYVIMNGQITKIGDAEGDLRISPQSLMNQDAQKEILKILDNTADFLLTNGKNMSDAEIKQVADNLLSIFGNINKAISDALKNPLASDLAFNLANEKANYNDIFNSLPADSSKIRYVEEYTQEEWAAEATRLVQQQIARQMAAQMERLMGILEDTLVARMTTLPDSVSYEMDGNSMVVSVGPAAEVLKEDHVCTSWTIVFPEKVEYLNTESIENDTIIRVSLICYQINPYAYVDNANVLVSSGALSASLKTLEGTVIDVNQTTDPISVTGQGGGTPSSSVLMMSSPYLPYQILDVHTFHTVQWNSSVVVEMQPSIISKENDSDSEIWVFVGFQRLPGPYENDHDFRFQIDKKRKSSLFISSWDLFNRTGLFYVGVGIRSLSLDANSTGKTIVKYPTPAGVEGSWNFVQSINYDYRMRAITKGCFFFVMDAERWDSSGLKTGVYVGDKVIQCLTYHMTYYAGGIFTPELPSDFDYIYVEESFPKSCLVLLAILLILCHQAVVAWMAQRHTKRDTFKGQLHVMGDNHPLDTYKYIVAVDTGFKMFATTDSEIHMNIMGEEWQSLDRNLNGGEGRTFRWGTTERFLMATQYPLGQLKYLSLWIHNVGLQHRESWFCDRVIVYDLQTKEEFHFNVNNWLGTQNGDGKTERTVGATKRPCFLREATWGHRLFENIAYISMYTGGGTLWRLRVTRPIHCVSVYLSLFVVSYVNVRIAKGEDFSRLPSFEKNIFGFYFSVRDIVFGLIYSVLLLPLTILFPIVFSLIKSDVEESRLMKLRRIERQRGFAEARGQIPFALKALACTIVLFVGFSFMLLSIHAGFSMDQDMQNAFARRFYIMLACWILIAEPLKGLIITCFNCICRREHYYINRYEKAFMKILSRADYPNAPSFEFDDEIVSKLAKLKSERSEDQRMRDEQLFNTARQVITFFASIFVLLGLTYFCRDRFGFYYQQEVTNLFSINGNPYDGKSFMGIQNIDHFFNWTKSKLVPALRVSWYDQQPAWDMRGFMNDKTSRSMGYGIIRQVRSKYGDHCEIDEHFSQYFQSCETYTDMKYEDSTEAYTVGWAKATTKDSNFTRQEYTYRSAEELQGKTIIGNMDYYTGGGYAWDIIGTASDLSDQMDRLQNEGWVDDNTRAVIIEFSMYNAQVNYFAVIQLVLENPPDGALYPSAWIETVRLMKYVGEDGKYVMAFEALYVLFTIVNCFAQIYELSCVGFKVYLSTFWHLLGFLVVLCSAVSLYAYGLRYLSMQEASDRFMATNGNTYIRLDSQRDLELYFTWLMGFVVFAVSIQMIRILRFNRRISVLALTLEKSASSMAGFALVYLLINAAFDSALYTLLYSKLLNYRNFLAVTEATTASLLGKFSVTDVLTASTLGSVMFMMFMMTGTIVLVNMFVMIVMYEFESVRNDKDNQTNEYEVVQHISSKLLQTVGLFERSDNPNSAFPNYLEHCRAVDVLEKQVNSLDLLIENMREVKDDDVEEAKKGVCERKMYFPQ